MEQRAVVPVEPAAQALAAFEQELADAAGYARAEKSAATRKAYWKDFEIFGALVPGPRPDRPAGLR